MISNIEFEYSSTWQSRSDNSLNNWKYDDYTEQTYLRDLFQLGNRVGDWYVYFSVCIQLYFICFPLEVI